jgi:hypothetical protein
MCSSQFASLKHKANSLRCFKNRDSKAASKLACKVLVVLINALEPWLLGPNPVGQALCLVASREPKPARAR